MSRSVVLRPSVRCEGCFLPPRWCVCAAHRTVESALHVDVLMHQREQWRPSSTGHLINRTLTGSRQIIWRRDSNFRVEEIAQPGRELWILHPNGEPLPREARPEAVQVLMLDGSWRESVAMERAIGAGVRTVSLPMSGESRYWLRNQQEGGRFSTVEALLFLLRALRLEEAATVLADQFEWHVYGGLRSRGALKSAAEFLATSPIRERFPAVLAQINRRRPLGAE